MMKPVLISALDLWASWQREAALNMTRAALMPLAAFASMARSAEAARGQSEVSGVAREASEGLKKGAAPDEIRQAAKDSEKAAARGGGGSRKKKSAKIAGSSRESSGHRRKSARSGEDRID
jgi:hypothetical protein